MDRGNGPSTVQTVYWKDISVGWGWGSSCSRQCIWPGCQRPALVVPPNGQLCRYHQARLEKLDDERLLHGILSKILREPRLNE